MKRSDLEALALDQKKKQIKSDHHKVIENSVVASFTFERLSKKKKNPKEMARYTLTGGLLPVT